MTSNPDPDNFNDEALVVELINNPEAFAAFFDEYFPRLYKYVFYRVGDTALADDLVAEIFERLLVNLPSFDPVKAPFSAWIFGIARHLVMDHLRRQRRQQLFSLKGLWENQTSLQEVENASLATEQKETLNAALRQLSTRELDVLSLKYASTLTNRQIAPLLGLSESNVGVILYRALHKLRNEMEHSEEK